MQVKALKSKLENEAKILQQQSDELTAVQTEIAVIREAKANSDVAMQSCKEEMKFLKSQCEKDQREARLAIEKVL